MKYVEVKKNSKRSFYENNAAHLSLQFIKVYISFNSRIYT